MPLKFHGFENIIEMEHLLIWINAPFSMIFGANASFSMIFSKVYFTFIFSMSSKNRKLFHDLKIV